MNGPEAAPDAVPDDKRVHVFDTTLRDGEQSPGISLNTQEKVEIAHQLARLGVDVIEAGFPITSPGDFEAVETIARNVEGPARGSVAARYHAHLDARWRRMRETRARTGKVLDRDALARLGAEARELSRNSARGRASRRGAHEAAGV